MQPNEHAFNKSCSVYSLNRKKLPTTKIQKCFSWKRAEQMPYESGICCEPTGFCVKFGKDRNSVKLFKKYTCYFGAEAVFFSLHFLNSERPRTKPIP